jgi:hypothetical protein
MAIVGYSMERKCVAYLGNDERDRLPAVRVYAVVSEQMSDEPLELFVDRQVAELMVENWEPGRARSRRRALRRAGRA